MDVGDFLEFERAFHREWETRTAAEIENVARFGDFLAEQFDLRFRFEEFDDVARDFEKRGAEFLFILRAQRSAFAPRRDGECGPALRAGR